MKRILYTLGCTLVVFQLSYAQYVAGMGSLTLDKNENIRTFDYRNGSDIRGFRYTTADFCEGEIWLTNNRHYTNEMKFRFDEAENAVQVKYPDGKEMQLVRYEIDRVKMKTPEGKTLVFLRTELPNKLDGIKIFQVLYATEKFVLLKLPVKYLDEVKEAKPFSLFGENYTVIKPIIAILSESVKKEFDELKLSKKDFTQKLAKWESKVVSILKKSNFKEGKFNTSKAVSLLDNLEDALEKAEAEKKKTE